MLCHNRLRETECLGSPSHGKDIGLRAELGYEGPPLIDCLEHTVRAESDRLINTPTALQYGMKAYGLENSTLRTRLLRNAERAFLLLRHQGRTHIQVFSELQPASLSVARSRPADETGPTQAAIAEPPSSTAPTTHITSTIYLDDRTQDNTSSLQMQENVDWSFCQAYIRDLRARMYDKMSSRELQLP